MIHTPTQTQPIHYPDSDGMPMAENSKQYRWIVTVEGNIEYIYRDDPNVFVAGDMLWYPVEGNNKIRQAPDTFVAFGRPKGDRGSYRQWVEGGIAPQVVFEILSPGNRPGEMTRKFQFYENYGVEEFYQYDPDFNVLDGWLRQGDKLRPIEQMDGWISPRLGIRFELAPETLIIYRPDGERFLTQEEIWRERDEMRQRSKEDQLARTQAQQRADAAQQQAETARQQAESARQQAESAKLRAEALSAKLRALGVDPEST